MANPSCSSALTSMHKDSRSTSKTKPKIRIIHIFTPEIIKTDVENFRGLVQSLTGKSSGNDQKTMLRRIKKSRTVCTGRKGRHDQLTRSRDNCENSGSQMMMMQAASLLESRGMVNVKREELGIWNAESSGGFLNGFEHLDGYVQELVEFPLLSSMDHTASTSSSSSQSTVHFFEL